MSGDAVERLSRAESVLVVTGSLSVNVITVATLVLAFVLVRSGHEVGGFLAALPAVVTSTAQIAAAVQRRR